MRIVAFRAENMASSWFRSYCWMDAMRARGHKALYSSPSDKSNIEIPEFEKLVRDADVVVVGRTNEARLVAALHAGRDLYGYKLIVDTDDDVTALHLNHPVSSVVHAGSGFARLSCAQYRAADAVTVSTKTLYDDILKYNKRVYHIPNCISPEIWDTVRFRQKEAHQKNDLRIYWGGGGGHYGDLLLVKNALQRIVRERPHVKLVFQNFMPDWAASMPANRAFYLPFVEFGMYHKVLAWLCADIAIAPLEDNQHNRCKSDVKYLDYAMAGIPGVYQRLAPYDTVIDGVTGLLAGPDWEWYEKLNVLIEHAEMRQQIAARAKKHVRATQCVEAQAAKYEAMLYEVLGTGRQPKVEPALLTEGRPLEATPWLT